MSVLSSPVVRIFAVVFSIAPVAVVDYGHGFLDIKQDGKNVIVDATLANLELHGKPVKPGIKCLEPEVRAVRLQYDAKTRGFVAGRVRCAKIPSQ